MLMQTPALLHTPSDIETRDAIELATALNMILADSFALYIKTKNFHWHASGPHFRDHHLMLDDQATQILSTTDAIAERVRKTGSTTLRSIGDIARHQRIRDSDANFSYETDMLGELHNDNLSLIASLRTAKALADAARDNATSGAIDGWTDQAEERVWFLFESTRNA